MSLDARPADAPNALAHLVSLAPARLPAALLAKVGERYASALSELQRWLDRMDTPIGPAAELAACRAEMARLEQLGVQLQAMARVLSRISASPLERIDLSDAVRESVLEWEQAPSSDGMRISCGDCDVCQVQVSAGVLKQLLDLGIEHAMRIGSVVVVRCVWRGEPGRPVVVIEAQRDHDLPASDDEQDDLPWQMFVQLAASGGLSTHRSTAGRRVSLLLNFGGEGGGLLP